MKAIILYHSKTGFTEQYAKWLAAALHCQAIAFAQRKQVDFAQYDTILFGSWNHAGKLQKLDWLKQQLPSWKTKKIVVFGVGAMPMDSPEAGKALEQSFTEEERAQVSLFYLQGGLRYERMGPASKLMMKLFSQMIQKKQNKTPQEEEMARHITQSYDGSDKRYLKPIVAMLNPKQ